MVHSKAAHLLQIVAAGLIGDAGITTFQVPSPDDVQKYGSLILQAIVTLVTVYATLKKAFQKPIVTPAAPAENV